MFRWFWGDGPEKKVTCCGYEDHQKYLEHVLGNPKALSLFNPDYHKCYCQCQNMRIDGRSRPHWDMCRFAVHVEPRRATARNTFAREKVYHGTKAEFVNGILRLGYLLKVGDETPEGEEIGSRDMEKIACGNGVFTRKVVLREGRIEGVENFEPKKLVFVSPSLAYASHRVYAAPATWGGYQWATVMEFRIKPDSFLTGPQTMGKDHVVVDDAVDANRFEYYTARHGILDLTGVIVIRLSTQGQAQPKWSCTRPPRLLIPRPLVLDSMSLACPNAQRRWQVLCQLGVNQCYFNHKFDRCYCGCQRLPDTLTEGPAGKKRNYVLPKPMTRFALFVDEKRAAMLGYWDNWHTCFHGTKLGTVNDVVECGYLLYPGCTDIHGKGIVKRSHDGRIAEVKEEKMEIPKNTVCVTPSSRYASSPSYASRSLVDGKNVHVTLMFKIQPDSYKVFPSTLKKSVVDPYVRQAEMEWHTRRHGTLLMYGILVCED